MTQEVIVMSATPDLILPPGQNELPCDDGEPMETWRHYVQMQLLINTLEPWLQLRGEGFVGGNMFVYYSLAQIRNQDFKGPDFFVVLDVPRGERKSWVVWEEGKGPDVVIELLSESTAGIDKTSKKQIYERQLKVAEYYWFDPFHPDDLAGFGLHQHRYDTLTPDERGYLISPTLGLALVRWQGSYHNIETTWLRWATPGGELLPTEEEIARAERQRADTEAQRAEAQAQRADTEAQARLQAEQRAEAAEAELARLKARLEQK
jgi:Uma2 family endonuclease